jgi:hypothetical protein
VPLLYQASACAMTKAVVSAPWRSYEVQQSKGALPTGPIVILVHIASAWVPYTSESKEAIAHYPEVLKEMRLAIMECGRRLQRFLRRRRREVDEQKKRDYITKYLDTIGEALQEILAFSDAERARTTDSLKIVLEQSRTMAVNDSERAKKRRGTEEAVVDEPAAPAPSGKSPVSSGASSGGSAGASVASPSRRATKKSPATDPRLTASKASTSKAAAKAPQSATQATAQPSPKTASSKTASSKTASPKKSGPAPASKKARR